MATIRLKIVVSATETSRLTNWAKQSPKSYWYKPSLKPDVEESCTNTLSPHSGVPDFQLRDWKQLIAYQTILGITTSLFYMIYRLRLPYI
jgi:hypothetical protein